MHIACAHVVITFILKRVEMLVHYVWIAFRLDRFFYYVWIAFSSDSNQLHAQIFDISYLIDAMMELRPKATRVFRSVI